MSQLDFENYFFCGENRREPTERSRNFLVFVFIDHFGGIFDYEDGSNWNFPPAALGPVLKIKDRGTKDSLGKQRAREPKIGRN